MTPAPDVDISPACALSAQAKCAIILCTRINSAPEYTLHQSLLCTRIYAAPYFSLHQILLHTRIFHSQQQFVTNHFKTEVVHNTRISDRILCTKESFVPNTCCAL